MDINVAVLSFHMQVTTAQTKYANKIGDGQAIMNPLFDFGNKHRGLIGMNSIGEPMIGYRYALPMSDHFKFTIGSYYQDFKEFKKVGVIPVGFEKLNLVPIVGIEYNYKHLAIIATPTVSVLAINFKFN